MESDIYDIPIFPGNFGRDCLYDGEHFDENGIPIEICCDECNYLLCCIKETNCKDCNDDECPRKQKDNKI